MGNAPSGECQTRAFGHSLWILFKLPLHIAHTLTRKKKTRGKEKKNLKEARFFDSILEFKAHFGQIHLSHGQLCSEPQKLRVLRLSQFVNLGALAIALGVIEYEVLGGAKLHH